MKVALFVHCFFPDHFYGTETYTLQLAKNLQLLGHQPTVVSAVFRGEPRRKTVISRYTYDGVPVIVFDKNRLPHWNIRDTYWQEDMREPIRYVLEELDCDVVHVTHLLNHTAVLLEEVKAFGIPIVATLTDFFGFCYNNKLEAADGGLCTGPDRLRINCVACHIKAGAAFTPGSRADRISAYPWLLSATAAVARTGFGAHFATRPDLNTEVADVVDRPGILFQAYRHYDAMIAPTTFLRDAYVRNGFDPARLHLSHFGVDIDRSPKRPRTAGRPLTVGFIGQLAPHKGVDLLLKAARDLPPDALRIRVYGPEDQDPAYMAQLRALAGPHTEFLGTFPSQRMASVMAEFDILAIPSTWYENSPLVLLNALATHTPVLVADVPGLTEFIGAGERGWSFKRGNLKSLIAVLKRLIADPHEVRTVAARTAYARDTRTMTNDVVALYRRAIDDARRDGRTARRRANDGPRRNALDPFRGGIRGDFDAWVTFNRIGAFNAPESLASVAAFPPPALMAETTGGVTDIETFAAHGCDILQAVSKVSPAPMGSYTDILELGVGVGRLARMFQGVGGQYTGVDVNQRYVAWVASALNYVTAVAMIPGQPLPFVDNRFDCVISIADFTHMNEQDQFLYLAEIARVTRPDAMVFLTVHGERALQRAETEARISAMMDISKPALDTARQLMHDHGFSFVVPQAHLASGAHGYGITFIAKDYIEREWSKYLEVVRVYPGAIHDFQDIVVLRKRPA